jgi:hypothetical protein
VPRTLASHGLLEADWADTLGSFWSHGPLLAALAAAIVTGGRPAVRAWGARLIRWQVGYLPYAIALLGPAVFWFPSLRPWLAVALGLTASSSMLATP